MTHPIDLEALDGPMSGEQVRAARQELGLSLYQLAEWLGLQIENGARKIRRWEDDKEEITGPAQRAIVMGLRLARRGEEIWP